MMIAIMMMIAIIMWVTAHPERESDRISPSMPSCLHDSVTS
jgi:hypothetical protein